MRMTLVKSRSAPKDVEETSRGKIGTAFRRLLGTPVLPKSVGNIER